MPIKERYSEPPLTTYLFSKAAAAKLPLSGTFELSPLCNFNCRMCYVRRTPQEVRESPRPPLTAEQWLELARRARDEGMLYLLLTGGEPLLWPDFWPLYEALVGMGLLVSVNTNGSLIDETAAERFRAMPPNRINITLYGSDDASYASLCRTQDAYPRVKRAIELLQAAEIPVKLNGTLTPENAGALERNIAYARERGLVYEVNTYMFPPLRRDAEMVGRNERFTPEEAARYSLLAYRLQHDAQEYRRRLEAICRGTIPPPGLDEGCVDPADGHIRCRAGSASFWITWDGWMTPCGMMPTPCADVTALGFAAAWRDITHKSADTAVSGVCSACRNRGLCHCCAAMALTETGETSGIPQYLCRMVEALRQQAAQELKDLGGD